MADKQKPKVSKLKLVLAAIGVVYGIVFVVWIARTALKPSAQQGPSELSLHPERAQEIIVQRAVMRFKDDLDLTDDQVEKAKAILAAGKKEADAIMQDLQKEPAERLAEGLGHIGETTSRIEAILDDKQKAKFQELVEERAQGAMSMVRGLFGNSSTQTGQRSESNESK